MKEVIHSLEEIFVKHTRENKLYPQYRKNTYNSIKTQQLKRWAELDVVSHIHNPSTQWWGGADSERS
jgi:hypothetical protein